MKVASSYTKTEVTKMIDMYTDNPCLEVVGRLSVLFNRPRKSIISKLVKEGVYIRKGYITKLGTIPITKLQVLRQIEDAMEIKLPGLDKAPKPTLITLSKTAVEMAELLEEALGDLSKALEISGVRAEMLKQQAFDNDPIQILREGKE